MLSVGHKWSDIQDYTIGQFKVFCAAAFRQKAQDQAALISSVAVGAQGSAKSIKETVSKIAKEAKQKWQGKSNKKFS